MSLTCCLLSFTIPCVEEICRFRNDGESERILSGLRWIGLFSSDLATVRGDNHLDSLCAQVEKELSSWRTRSCNVAAQTRGRVEGWQEGILLCLCFMTQSILISAGDFHLHSRTLG